MFNGNDNILFDHNVQMDIIQQYLKNNNYKLIQRLLVRHINLLLS